MTTQNTRLETARELALLALLALLWGSSYLFIKVAVAEIPPLTLIAARVTVAAGVLLAVVAWKSERLPAEPALWGALLVQAALNGIVPWTVLAWGQQYVDSALASVLNSTSPLFVFFITWAVTRHEAVGAMKLAGAMLGLVGVVLIVGVDALAGLGRQVAGQLAALAGALLYGLAAVNGRRFASLSPTVTAAATMLWASLCLVPASLVFERPWTLDPSAQALASAFALAVFCTALALMLYFRLVHTLGSLGVASQAYLRAGVGVILGVVLLGETVTPLIAVGLAASILGVAAINLAPRVR